MGFVWILFLFYSFQWWNNNTGKYYWIEPRILARIVNIWKRYSKWDPSFWSAFQNNRHILLIKKLISVTRNIAIQGSIQFYRKFSWKEGVGCDDFHVWRISCSSSIFDTWNKPWNSRRQATAWRRRRRRVIREPNRFVLMKFLDAVSSWHSSAERVTWLFIEFQRRTTPGRGEPSLLAPCLRGIKLALRGNN